MPETVVKASSAQRASQGAEGLRASLGSQWMGRIRGAQSLQGLLPRRGRKEQSMTSGSYPAMGQNGAESERPTPVRSRKGGDR